MKSTSCLLGHWSDNCTPKISKWLKEAAVLGWEAIQPIVLDHEWDALSGLEEKNTWIPLAKSLPRHIKTVSETVVKSIQFWWNACSFQVVIKFHYQRNPFRVTYVSLGHAVFFTKLSRKSWGFRFIFDAFGLIRKLTKDKRKQTKTKVSKQTQTTPCAQAFCGWFESGDIILNSFWRKFPCAVSWILVGSLLLFTGCIKQHSFNLESKAFFPNCLIECCSHGCDLSLSRAQSGQPYCFT